MEHVNEARLIAGLHHPSGAYCGVCDSVQEFPGDIGEVNNPKCTHRYRSCATCWDHEDRQTAYPCPTIQAAAVLDETGLIATYMEQWDNLVILR